MDADRALIIIPTYNERENVRPLINRLLELAATVDVLVIDDNSPDGTATVAEQAFTENPRVSIVVRAGPRSYGRSLLDGYRVALDRGYARVVQMDSDFSHDPDMVPRLIETSNRADVVIGSRYCSGGRVANWPARRRLLSRFANQYVAWITGVTVHDSTSGFRCYTQRAIQVLLDVGVNAEGYAFLVETTFRAQRAGLRISEVPITFIDRRSGQSKMSTKVILESVLKPWRLRLGS